MYGPREMLRKQRWAGVVRVSHVGGRGGESFHADRDQVQALETHAAKLGDDLVLLPPELDVSGGAALENRPSLLAAVEGVERGDYDGIMVAYLSRLGRSVREQLRAWDRVEAAGGRIVVVQEGIDTSTPTGRLQRTMMLGIAEHELDLHRERFANLREWATAAGIWQRRQTPRGYGRDEETRRLVPNGDADAVRAAFRAKAAGTPLTALARRLEMTPSGVRQMLKNRVYLGELRVGDHVNPGAHPALVTAEEFEAAQSQTARPARSRRNNGPALLAGLVTCAGCGHRMTRSGSSKVPQYACPTNHSGERCPAPSAVTAANLDRHVEAIALRELERLTVTALAGDQSETKRQALRAAEEELAAYLGAVSASDVGPEAFAAAARKRREAVDQARGDLRAELARRPAALPYATGADVWPTLSPSQRNQVLRGLLAAVVVERSGGRGIVRPLPERVRVLRFGASLTVPGKGNGAPVGILPIALADLDVEDVLGMNVEQDAPQHLAG